MTHSQQEIIAHLANEVFEKRQRLIRASQAKVDILDDRTAETLDTEYRTAQSEYAQAAAAFARAMKVRKPAV